MALYDIKITSNNGSSIPSPSGVSSIHMKLWNVWKTEFEISSHEGIYLVSLIDSDGMEIDSFYVVDIDFI